MPKKKPVVMVIEEHGRYRESMNEEFQLYGTFTSVVLPSNPSMISSSVQSNEPDAILVSVGAYTGAVGEQILRDRKFLSTHHMPVCVYGDSVPTNFRRIKANLYSTRVHPSDGPMMSVVRNLMKTLGAAI